MEETKLSKDLLLLIGLKIYKDKDIVHVDDKDFEKVVKVELELQWDKKLRGSEKVVANIIIIESFFKEIKLKEYPGRNVVKRRCLLSVRRKKSGHVLDIEAKVCSFFFFFFAVLLLIPKHL